MHVLLALKPTQLPASERHEAFESIEGLVYVQFSREPRTPVNQCHPSMTQANLEQEQTACATIP